MTRIQRKTFAPRPWHIYILLPCTTWSRYLWFWPGCPLFRREALPAGRTTERPEYWARTWAMLMNDRQSNMAHVEMLIRLSLRLLSVARRAINISRDVVTMAFPWLPWCFFLVTRSSNLKEPTWDSAWWSECFRIFPLTGFISQEIEWLFKLKVDSMLPDPLIDSGAQLTGRIRE